MKSSPLPSHLFFGGSGEDYDDFATLTATEAAGGVEVWSCFIGSCKGDLVLISCVSLHQAIVAAAEVMSDAVPGEFRPYETTLGNVMMLKKPILRTELRSMFPAWAWTISNRGKTKLKPEIAERLWKRALTSGP